MEISVCLIPDLLSETCNHSLSSSVSLTHSLTHSLIIVLNKRRQHMRTTHNISQEKKII